MVYIAFPFLSFSAAFLFVFLPLYLRRRLLPFRCRLLLRLLIFVLPLSTASVACCLPFPSVFVCCLVFASFSPSFEPLRRLQTAFFWSSPTDTGTIRFLEAYHSIAHSKVIPRQLCDNAGFDATDVLNKLRQKHALPSGKDVHDKK